jgi:hypothetical protein
MTTTMGTGTDGQVGRHAGSTDVVNGPEDDDHDWGQVDWPAVEAEVRRLRQRIFTASQAGDLRKVRTTPASPRACLSRMRGQRARPVLRGPGRSNASGLPDELVNGTKANAGREWQPKGRPERVDVHDFPDDNVPKAIPYGVFDLGANKGWMSVGDDHDTAAFAVNAIRRWWEAMGRERYPQATTLMVTADAGGSNGYRNKLCKLELARLAADTGLVITVCHYPPGTSKWNKIEHRMFSFITKNWRGRPLTSYRVIAATTTETGLRILAEWDQGSYPTGTEVSDTQVAALPIARHDWHPDWNYDVAPSKVKPPSRRASK